MKLIAYFKHSIDQYVYFIVVTMLIWAKTYIVQRFGFDLPVEGWYQEFILLINPVSSILLALCFGMFFFKGHSHAAVIVISAASSFILFANLLYYRCFNDFITIPAWEQFKLIGDLWSSIFALFRPVDLLVFTDTLFFIFMIFVKKYRAQAFNPIQMISVIHFSFLLFIVNLLMAEHVRPELLTRTFDRNIVVKSIGTYNYHVYDAVMNFKMESKKVFARKDDLAAIENFMLQLPKDIMDPNTFGIAKGRNVFLISLESLQSFVINRQVSGQEITPFLNTLLKDSFYFENFYHQTGQGKTSDAEFAVDTSLYPLPRGAVFFSHPRNTYRTVPNIVKEHGYYPVVFHANHQSFWNRNQMYPNMGYEKFFASGDYSITAENSVGWGLKDIPFFEQSIEKIRSLPQPFYCKLVTLTNHYPFDLKEEDRMIPEFTSKSATVNRYIPTVRYMDEALKHFFERVKAIGAYEHSIFILYGDHNGISKKHSKAMAQLLGKEKKTALDQIQLERVPLIIHIPGVAGKKINTVGGQVDLKPTILHLLGIETKQEPDFGNDLFAVNKPEFVVLRNGNFVTDKYVYTKNGCYDKSTAEKIDIEVCKNYKENAVNSLKFSDDIIYGDLLRFLNFKAKS
ncbi:LTA synthase family protein [Paenibacillus sedimenti]|uniref:LTA synthase family protein n=1 Tax=Paenibacillus sedimenti TaxID=2770274 RepID=A0A926KMF3_9BACL|nr:LTA synthase family protein [Paenibacillus sedimenti]MBD0378824.1 LTA synthase family protein [Paenibacillus sedimenti]